MAAQAVATLQGTLDTHAAATEALLQEILDNISITIVGINDQLQKLEAKIDNLTQKDLAPGQQKK